MPLTEDSFNIKQFLKIFHALMIDSWKSSIFIYTFN